MCMKVHTLLCLLHIFIPCSFISVYNSAQYMKCVRECADTSMCVVIDSIKTIPRKRGSKTNNMYFIVVFNIFCLFFSG